MQSQPNVDSARDVALLNDLVDCFFVCSLTAISVKHQPHSRCVLMVFVASGTARCVGLRHSTEHACLM